MPLRGEENIDSKYIQRFIYGTKFGVFPLKGGTSVTVGASIVCPYGKDISRLACQMAKVVISSQVSQDVIT